MVPKMVKNLLIHLILAFLFAECVICASPPPNGNSEIDQCIASWIKANNMITSRYSREHMTTICQRSQHWAKGVAQAHKEIGTAARQGQGTVAEKGLTPNQLAYWRSFDDQPGSTPETDAERNNIIQRPRPKTTPKPIKAKALRKEYRVLTDEERARYHAAVKQLKTITVDALSRYHVFILVHTYVTSPGAHDGHSFLPWHREFLKRYELALREIDPSVALPYWDSTLDQPLPNPADSIMWTDDFMGTSNGTVVSGPFSNWAVLDGMLKRHLTAEEARGLFYQDSDVQFAMNRTKFDQFSSCVDPTFERIHSGVHRAVGGHMVDLQSSPSDPIFYMHHCFIDYMWEQFRQPRQSPAQREQDYPKAACIDENEVYVADAPLQPFDGMKNKDGLSNRYTRDLYSYQQRPVCTSDKKACTPASPYLFCDNRSNKCVAKVRLGGNCSGFEGQDVCYKSKCTSGRCVG